MITVFVNAAKAIATDLELLTTGRAGLQCRVVFSDDWDGLTKTAVIRAGDVAKDVLGVSWTAYTTDTTADESDSLTASAATLTIPHECLTEVGEVLYLGVYGTDGNGTIVIPTIYARLGKIHEGADPSGDTTYTQTADVTAQLQAAIEKKQDKLTFDTTPTSGSKNPVTSEGIKAALDEKADMSHVDESFLPLSGGKMTGDIDATGHFVRAGTLELTGKADGGAGKEGVYLSATGTSLALGDTTCAQIEALGTYGDEPVVFANVLWPDPKGDYNAANKKYVDESKAYVFTATVRDGSVIACSATAQKIGAAASSKPVIAVVSRQETSTSGALISKAPLCLALVAFDEENSPPESFTFSGINASTSYILSYSSDAWSYAETDTADVEGKYLPLSGGRMTGNLDVGGRALYAVRTLSFDTEASVNGSVTGADDGLAGVDVYPTFKEVELDSQKVAELFFGGRSIQEPVVFDNVLWRDPASDYNAANKKYVDEVISGFDALPDGGTAGQVLTKTETGAEWADAKGGGASIAGISFSVNDNGELVYTDTGSSGLTFAITDDGDLEVSA